MSLTMTMLLVSWAKHAPLISCFASVRYPEVRNASALATRCGVLRSPSRAGSSPISINSSRTRRPIFSVFKSMAGFLSQRHSADLKCTSEGFSGRTNGASSPGLSVPSGYCATAANARNLLVQKEMFRSLFNVRYRTEPFEGEGDDLRLGVNGCLFFLSKHSKCLARLRQSAVPGLFSAGLRPALHIH